MSRNKVEPATTPWFPISVQPVRAGVYQVQTNVQPGTQYSFWSGTVWKSTTITARAAESQKFHSVWMTRPQAQWRGLAQEPKQ